MSIQISFPDGSLLFRARVCPTATLQFMLFDSSATFADFIRAGVTSYGTAIRGQRLTKVDLHKTETVFEPLTVLD